MCPDRVAPGMAILLHRHILVAMDTNHRGGCMIRRRRVSAGARAGIVLVSLAAVGGVVQGGHLPNNFPFLNGAGAAATFSTAGFVDLANAFHTPQGTNG